MALTTSLAGRVRNTSLPKSHALLPLLEAVVNSIQAIDARFGGDVGRGRLSIKIQRSPQGELDLGPAGPGRAPLKPIVGFSIEDNGVGFTPENMTSFETLDSDHKATMGCRGVGRLLWLKAFDRISVRSTYEDESGDLHGLQFRFSVAGEVEAVGEADYLANVGTIVSLSGFQKPYQQSAVKSVETIARDTFEHCIWYFLRPGGAPEITVTDEDETVSLNTLMEEFTYSSMPRTEVHVKGVKFDMVNLQLKSSTRNTPRLHWCAASRVVMEENLTNKIPGLYGRLKDEDSSSFTYACYLFSEFLDSHVRADRTDFDIAKRIPGAMPDEDVSLDDIREAVLKEVEKILAGPLSAARKGAKARVIDFVSNKAPRYRPVLSRLESLGITVDPSIKDHDLELLLHRYLQKLDADAFVEGQAVFAEAGSAPPEGYAERLARYLDTVTDINQSDLAAYVSRRRTILDLLAKLIRSDDQGRYSREDAIHSLLIPMRTESNDLGTDSSNLWIIDERLAFHDYLASDKTLKSMPITGSESTTEPDVLATRLVGSPVLAAAGEKLPLPNIVVIEIKRPMRNDASEDKDPIQQCLDYVKRVRAGGVKTASGRQIPETHEAPAFCYVIADLTPTMIDRCKYATLRPTHDGLGYFGFNEPYKAYIEVVSFDRLVNAATERNRAFFDKLGLPSS
ncbi:ATP-binding protein [Streptantibioticus silvisoli]|uniref:ATP-binding protein n=1 Tax=Streptantibioticus silvisoli TaxID=2705255 RepID=A0ABT6WAE9_9ACTN|nr:ATP-binding protein [Streptantibioticus silvisoli]MDI5967143.1 ATP-binding protein [Streptantibioticus silvisoli]